MTVLRSKDTLCCQNLGWEGKGSYISAHAFLAFGRTTLLKSEMDQTLEEPVVLILGNQWIRHR